MTFKGGVVPVGVEVGDAPAGLSSWDEVPVLVAHHETRGRGVLRDLGQGKGQGRGSGAGEAWKGGGVGG